MNPADSTVQSLLEDGETCRNCGSVDVEKEGNFFVCLECDSLWTYGHSGEYVDLTGDHVGGFEEPPPHAYRPDPYMDRPGNTGFDRSRAFPNYHSMTGPDRLMDPDNGVNMDYWSRSGQKDPDPIPLEAKRQHQVFEHGPFIIIKMPADEQFIRREGFDMSHCLLYAYREYCARLREGKQLQFSLVDTRDGLPKVNFEISLEESSYAGPVGEPVVTQIRGIRNQCPPKDEYLPALMAFFETHPEWKVGGHGVKNFDRQVDGDKVIARWEELQQEMGGA